jgi:hypothetical protein
MSIRTHSQVITLKVTDDSIPISYVSLYDSVNRFYSSCDSLGCAKIKSGNYSLLLSHVSYSTRLINIKKVYGDTTICIALQKRSIELPEFAITGSRNYHLSKEIYETGNYYRKSGSSILLRLSIKMGIFIPPIDNGKENMVRSIKFKLKKSAKVLSGHFAEVKLFGVENELVDTSPLNKLPIYIDNSVLRKKNEIAINEKIEIPKGGLFISFEISPIYDKQTSKTFQFAGGWLKDEDCSLFLMKNSSRLWDTKTIYQKQCLTIEEKHCYANVSITYQIKE